MADNNTRPGRERLAIARDAGIGRISPISIVAGTLCAYGAFSLIAALAGAILEQADSDTKFEVDNWTGSGAVALLASAVVLLLAYLFGGYVAGRMARRAGLLHGLAVAILSLVLGGIIGAVVGGLSDNLEVKRNLRSIGVPTTGDQVTEVAIAGLILSLAAIIVGAILGGILGERWHTKLARRAADPSVGPAAEAHDRADREDDDRDRRIGRDEPLRRDAAVSQRGDDNDSRNRPDGSQRATAPAYPSQEGDTPARAPDRGSDEPRYTSAEWARMQADERQGYDPDR